MLIRTVTTVSAVNSAGQVVEALPVREASAGETDIVGRPVTPIAVQEDALGIPVRFVTSKSVVNSAGQIVDTVAVTGGSPQPSASAMRLSDNTSYLTLAEGGRLLLVQG